jgi:UDP-N-acetyl-D-mannosaminuronic acid transferase (WecB/TagA/CpsF family)
MDKLSREDLLTFENLRLRQQVLNMEHTTLMRDMAARYTLVDGDSLDVFSGTITRAPKAEEPKAEPKTEEPKAAA